MHPFYDPNARMLATPGSRLLGALSMAAYLGFWTLALVVARREVDARFPRVAGGRIEGDPALDVVAARFARGEIDEREFRRMAGVLDDVRARVRVTPAAR